MPTLEITSRERSALRAAAHPLRPVVLIGDNGLSDAVLKEIEVNLTAHGLIKVRAGGQDRGTRQTMLDTICETLSCASVHHLGKMLILYRPTPGQSLPSAQKTEESAKRRASEPHTPKKLAAEGKVIAKRNARSPRKTEASGELSPQSSPAARRKFAETLNKAGKPARPATKKTTAHGIPARAGSALSLRAGARRPSGGIQRMTGGVRKTPRG